MSFLPIFDLKKSFDPFLDSQSSLPKKEEENKVAPNRKQVLENLQKTLKENEQQLAQHSILNCYVNQDTQLNQLVKLFSSESSLAQKALVLSNLSFSASGTGYEGGNLSSLASIYAIICKFIEKGHGVFSKEIPENVLKSLNELTQSSSDDLKQAALNSMKKVQSLEIGKSYCMKGGWHGSPISRHAMIYRFQKTSQNTFNIYVYNAQIGSELQQGGREIEGKLQTFPYFFFKDVTCRELFFSNTCQSGNPIVFENLHSLLFSEYAPYQCSTQRILKFFAHFAHRFAPADKKNSLFIRVQRSGNCSIKAINCLLLDLLGSTDQYKPVSLDLRLCILIASFHFFKNNTPTDRTFLFQLKEAAANFLRILDTNFQRIHSPISEEAYMKGSATASHILQEIHQIEETIAKLPKENLSLTPSFIQSEELEKIQQRNKNVKDIEESLKLQPSVPTIINCKCQCNLGKNASWKDLPDILKDLEVLIKSFTEANRKEDLVFQVDIALRNLSHLKKTIPSFSREESLQLQKALNQIQFAYNQALFARNKLACAESLNTSMEFLALTHSAALAADSEYGILKQFAISTQYFFEFPRNDRLFTTSSPAALQQRFELEKFFSSNLKSQLFNFESQFCDKDAFKQSQIPEGKLYTLYIHASPAISKKLRELDSNYEKESRLYPDAIHGAFNNCFIQFDETFFPDELKHISYLKTAAALACETSNIGNTSYSNQNQVKGIQSPQGHLVIYTSHTHWYTNSAYQNEKRYEASRCYYEFSDEFKYYAEHLQSNHQVERILPENRVLVEKDYLIEKEQKLLPFYLALAEPDVQTTILLNQIEENLDCLSSSSICQMLGHAFIKLVEDSQKGLFCPFIESLKTPETLGKFEHLIKVSKKHFIDSMPTESPRLEEMLFVIRLYSRALQVTGDLYPNYSASKETLECTQELLSYLNKALDLPLVSEKVKGEILVAKMGLLLGVPMQQQSADQLADLFLSATRVNQTYRFNLSKAQDYRFIEDCKRRYFALIENWQQILNQKEICTQFGHAVLKKAIPSFNLEVKWELVNHMLIGADSTSELWSLDLLQPDLRNSKGQLLERYGELNDFGTLQRLFEKKRYHLQTFGKETRFYDSKWGMISIIDSRSNYRYTQTVRRLIDQTWYTYIPNANTFKYQLHINSALFADHALWMNTANPQDIRAYNLKTGQEVYQIKNGICFDLSTNKVFTALDKEHKLFHRFELEDYINGWLDGSLTNQTAADDTVEFSRFVSEEGNPLYFKWNPEKQHWNYVNNSDYSISTDFTLPPDFKINSFLPLIHSNGIKQKILIPKGEISSKGYQQEAVIYLDHSKSDNIRHSAIFFEYDLTSSGQLIPQSLEAKVYLIRLLLAQKRYQQALDWIKTISISETTSESILNDVKNLIDSAKFVKDHSPNSAAIRLHAYHIFKKIHPFYKQFEDAHFDEAPKILDNYLVYIRSLNDVEQPLQLNKEKELEIVEFFLQYLAEHTGKEAVNEHRKLILERQKVLLEDRWINKNFSYPFLNLNKTTELRPIVLYHNFYVSKEEQKRKSSYEANSFFISHSFKEFSQAYETLRIRQNNAPEVQALLYDIYTADKRRTFSESQVDMLLIAASTSQAPALPGPLSSDEEKLNWYLGIEKAYLKFTFSTIHYDKKSSKLSFPLSSANVSHQSVDMKNKSVDLEPLQGFSLPLSLHRNQQDVSFNKWQKTYLEHHVFDLLKGSFPVKEPKTFKLKESEKIHAKAIEKHAEHYEKDCKKAKEIASSKEIFKQNANFEQLLKEMQVERDASKQNEKNLLTFIESLIKRAPIQLKPFAQEQAILLGEGRKTPTLEMTLRAAASKSGTSALIKLNPNLTEKEAYQLRSACIELMIEVTHQHHLDRVIHPLENWFKTSHSDYLEAAQEALAETRCYNPGTNLLPLLFEYLSGLRIRSKQATIINFVLETVLQSQDQSLQSKVFQLIMAGGKTSVIISMLMEVVSEAGLMSYIMCHHSQLASVKGNLALFQSKRFEKDIYVLDYSMQDLSKTENLDLILKRMKEADRKHCGIVMKTSFPQVLELKFVTESLRLTQIEDVQAKENQKKLLKKLSDILNLFTAKGVGIYDESDINLSLSTDVNVPKGEQKNVRAERAYLLKIIFETLLEPKVKDLLRFDKNLQSELSSHDFETIILPFIADKMFNHPILKLSNEQHLKSAFTRYIQGKIKPEDQKLADQSKTSLNELSSEQKENILFLRYLKQFSSSNNRYEKEAANLIVLTQRLLDKVLRISLSRSFNRAYGRDPAHDDGRVIPYLAVGEPAITKFGNIYMALSYQFQAALNGGVTKGEISFLAEKMTEAANFYAKKEKIAFNKTLEAQQFFRLTNIGLDEISNPSKLEEAYQYINDPQHPKRRLDIEAEIAPFHVRYHSKCVSSNAINNASQFNRAIACSGTLWNHPTYHRKFGQAALDEGTEGSILNLMAERANKTDLIHEIPNLELESFFKLIQQHPHKDKIRAVVDGAGLLRDYTTKDFAIKLARFLSDEEKNGGPKVDAIIYLHKFSAEEIKQGSPKESFVLLKKGETKPRLLKNTSQAEIERLGVKKENLFAIFDELRATGTDIHVAEDSIFLNTIDHKTPMRTFLQAALRARKAFKNQRVELIVSAKSRKEMVNEGQGFEDVKATLIKNEAILLKEQTNRARLAQIDDIIRSAIIKELLSAKSYEISDLVEKYENFLVSISEDNPYEQFGRIVGTQPILDVLTQYANRVLEKLKRTDSPSYETVAKNMKKLFEENFKKEIDTQEQMEATLSEDLNTTLEIEQEQEVQLELAQEKEVEVAEEIQLELNLYSYPIHPYPYLEKQWNLNPNEDLWPQIQKEIFSTSEVLNRTYREKISTKQYAPCFPQNVSMSKNFYYTCTEEAPIFHPYTKKACFILAVEYNKKMEFVLLSEKDTAHLKKWMQEWQPKGLYLVDLKGSPEINAQSLINKDGDFHHSLLQGLWYANFFNGNVEFLDQYPKLSKQLLLENKKIKTRFLQLRTAKNPQQMRKLYASGLFDLEKDGDETVWQQNTVIFGDRRTAIENNYTRIRQFDAAKVGEIPPEQVENLDTHQFKWLKTKEQIEAVPDEMVNYLAPEQMPLLPKEKVPFLKMATLIQAIGKDACQFLLPAQLKEIDPKQVEWLLDTQLDHLPSTVMERITDANQIQRFKGGLVRRLLEKQVNFIDPIDIVNLDDKQIGWLTKPALIQALAPEKVSLVNKESRQHLNSLESLLALDDDQGLIKEQKEKLKLYFSQNGINEQAIKPWQVSYLPQDNNLGNLTRPELIRKIPVGSVSFLQNQQVSHLTRTESALIAVLQYPAYTFVQESLYDLFTGEQTSKLDPLKDDKIIKKLQAQQAAHLTNEALQVISPDIVNQLEEKDIKRLTALDLLLKLNEDNLLKIDESQQIILKKNFEHIKIASELANIADQHLKFIPEPQAVIVSPDKVFHLTNKHWEHLSKKQIEKVMSQFHDRVNSIFIQALNTQALEAAQAKHADWLTDKQIGLLDNNHKTLIQGIKAPKLLSKLSNSALQLLSKDQVPSLEEPDFKRITDADLLLSAPRSHQNWLQEEQKVILSSAVQLQEANSIAEHHLEFASEAQVKALTDADKIKALPKDKISLLDEKQVQKIDPQDLKQGFVQQLAHHGLKGLNDNRYAAAADWLTPTQLSVLDHSHRAIISRLKAESLKDLTETALQNIEIEQVALLKGTDLNRLTADHLLIAIPEHRLKELNSTALSRLEEALNRLNQVEKLKAYHLPYLKVEAPILRPSFTHSIKSRIICATQRRSVAESWRERAN
jgi:hypothetical protein